MIWGETKTTSSYRGSNYSKCMTEIQGKSILVRVSARFELVRVRVIGSQLYFSLHWFPSTIGNNGVGEVIVGERWRTFLMKQKFPCYLFSAFCAVNCPRFHWNFLFAWEWGSEHKAEVIYSFYQYRQYTTHKDRNAIKFRRKSAKVAQKLK